MFVPAYSFTNPSSSSVPPFRQSQQQRLQAQQPQQQQPQQQQQPPVSAVPSVPVVPCPAACMKTSFGTMPETASLAKAVGVPINLVVRPLGAQTTKTGPVRLVPKLSEDFARCDECGAFINPYVTFAPNGSNWQCPFCGHLQSIPSEFASPINPYTKQRADTASRPELVHGCVEYVTQPGFFKRTPMAPSFVFVLDVCRTSVESGFLEAVVSALKKWIARYEDNPNTRVAFVLYSRTVTYVQFPTGSENYALHVYPDLGELNVELIKERMFVKPETIMVSLAFCRTRILKLLDDLATMLGEDGCNAEVGNALPSALFGVLRFSRFWGGRTIVFNGCNGALCDCGPHAISKPVAQAWAQRSADTKYDSSASFAGPNSLGTEGDVYRELAVEFSQRQTSVNVVVSAQSQGVAVLEQVARHTGGSFTALELPPLGEDQGSELSKTMKATAMRRVLSLLCRQTGWESAMYIYTSPGIALTNVLGNFFMRGSEHIATLCGDSSNTVTAELKIESSQKAGTPVFIQCIYMYTTVGSKRRVRVMTLCLPCSSLVHDLFHSLDVNTVAASTVRSVFQSLQSCSFHDARESVIGMLMQAMKAFRASFDKGAAPRNRHGLMLPQALETLPLFLLALLKSPVLAEESVECDIRALVACISRSMPVDFLLRMIHPKLYDLTALVVSGESSDDGSESVLPSKLPQLPLTETALQSGHLYLMDTGTSLILHEYGASNPELLVSLFGVDKLADIPLFKIVTNTLRVEDSEMEIPIGCRVLSLLIEHAESNSMPTPRILIERDIRELLVGDHTHRYYSYQEFVTMLAQ